MIEPEYFMLTWFSKNRSNLWSDNRCRRSGAQKSKFLDWGWGVRSETERRSEERGRLSWIFLSLRCRNPCRKFSNGVDSSDSWVTYIICRNSQDTLHNAGCLERRRSRKITKIHPTAIPLDSCRFLLRSTGYLYCAHWHTDLTDLIVHPSRLLIACIGWGIF